MHTDCLGLEAFVAVAELGNSVVTTHRWNRDIRAIYREPYVVLMPRDHPPATGFDWQTLVARHISDMDMSRTLGVAARRGAPLSSSAKWLLDMIESRLNRD